MLSGDSGAKHPVIDNDDDVYQEPTVGLTLLWMMKKQLAYSSHMELQSIRSSNS